MSNFYELKIQKIIKETPNAVSIAFEIPEDLKAAFQYKAGQYITIKKELAGKEIRRAYSLCSKPNSEEFKVAVKAVDNGTFSVFATTILKEGDVLEVSKPEGKFVLETSSNNSKNYLGIAAGSGITPIMSMIKEVLNEEPNSTFTLLYGNKTEAETIFKDEIDALKNEFSSTFNVQYVLSREEKENALAGRINAENLKAILKNRFDEAFICGPEEMIKTSKETLINYGLNEENIKFELFTASADTNETEGVYEGECDITVIVDEEEETFTMNSKTTVLTAALEEGLDAPYSCQGGICSSCLAKVTEGKAVMDKNSILSNEEIEEGLILTCQAHPVTKKITVDFDDV
ncbi:ring-1,2-phenylacetyl-CoA epoxidase subunit PaaE [Lutibacter oricola]|uniref:Ring-1,2-phenylacetyl-CoA epoxidase subunit PaaE n=1 Tax=Lutibacter oricola TaxID=762486 RepID=A0A1H2RFX8_9FLAO|nr:ferredoxin--NADP reductase [Lutibacter oricola]SDW17559.1 ring-1,2-phenylacetyl-CoA epoxidase subunit PaaE [Lutibacter oricola]